MSNINIKMQGKVRKSKHHKKEMAKIGEIIKQTAIRIENIPFLFSTIFTKFNIFKL